MKPNVGTIDRIVRAVFGAGMIGAGVYFHSWWGAVGAVPLLTAAMAWCPAYLPFGLSSCKD